VPSGRHHRRLRGHRRSLPTVRSEATPPDTGERASVADVEKFLATLQPPANLTELTKANPETKYVAFEFNSSVVQSLRMSQDGHVTAVKTSNAQMYLGIGTLPASGSMNGGTNKVWDVNYGLIFGDGLASSAGQVRCFHRFKVGDIILALGPVSSLMHVWLAFD
jgi:hypothetical protein